MKNSETAITKVKNTYVSARARRDGKKHDWSKSRCYMSARSFPSVPSVPTAPTASLGNGDPSTTPSTLCFSRELWIPTELEPGLQVLSLTCKLSAAVTSASSRCEPQGSPHPRKSTVDVSFVFSVLSLASSHGQKILGCVRCWLGRMGPPTGRRLPRDTESSLPLLLLLATLLSPSVPSCSACRTNTAQVPRDDWQTPCRQPIDVW